MVSHLTAGFTGGFFFRLKPALATRKIGENHKERAYGSECSKEKRQTFSGG
uniref:Uncharacterized protein n=1 Tax=Citrobacter freundii TaxID=546 RepID=A0A2R4AK46_CITFR|nr:hypothetical protein [Citrobacter freundii]